ncbi:MAG: murein transglycosylase A [Desulfuromonadales bacterium]|nr:murein transglycosylase A [Desulfuromonadales bacterium]NIR33934.1 murein transglycosylase A [Desulfuromonadales bacterium]NIS43956.1 murein transglycosylase A [Desulfuromonadales bacterium]
MARGNRWNIRRWSVVLLLLAVSGCTAPQVKQPPPPPPPPPETKTPPLQPVGWDDVDGWEGDDPRRALQAFLGSCRVLSRRSEWSNACTDAGLVDPDDSGSIRLFFEDHFIPYRVYNPDGTATGTVTGYYVPELAGSREKKGEYAYPLYAVPDNLLVVDLGDVYPSLKDYRLRGRLEGNRVVPYFSRAEIDSGKADIDAEVLFWVKNPVDLFFLQIQGSGRIRLEDGTVITVNYGNQNGHPYRSIGRELIARGEMSIDNMSLQAIKKWARENPAKVRDIFDHNPSYVFFRELPESQYSPPGSLGVPLTAGRSLAVDRRVVPLGAPVFLSTTWPNSDQPLRRLMVAQDTGGAIKGAVRSDFFWGFGDDAGALAGKMKQDGAMWVLLPPGVHRMDEAVATR